MRKRMLVCLALIPAVLAGSWAGARYPRFATAALPWMMWGAVACSAAGLAAVVMSVIEEASMQTMPLDDTTGLRPGIVLFVGAERRLIRHVTPTAVLVVKYRWYHHLWHRARRAWQ